MSDVKLVSGATPVLGSDPEFFFVKPGSKTGKPRIVGAEKLLPPSGKMGYGKSKVYVGNGAYTDGWAVNDGWVLDGVQVELNHPTVGCRASGSQTIQQAFRSIRRLLREKSEADKTTYSLTFDGVVTVGKRELESLKPESRLFGCAPSNNLYDAQAKVVANPEKYLKRAAGGHIHMGFLGNPFMMQNRERLIPLFDIFMGNTCVLLDRNPLAVERRKNYGRAGEYRLPKHGIEYRTLSNFWYHSYQLWSFVFGFAKQIPWILSSTNPKGYYGNTFKGVDLEKEILSMIDIKKVIKAINKNDVDLAWKNWEIARKFMQDHYTNPTDSYPFSGNPWIWDCFEFFAKKIQAAHEDGAPYNGLSAWFPQDPLEHWCNKPEGHGIGWESFRNSVVRQEWLASEGKTLDPLTNGVCIIDNAHYVTPNKFRDHKNWPKTTKTKIGDKVAATNGYGIYNDAETNVAYYVDPEGED